MQAGNGETEKGEASVARRVIERAWGHLPPALRERVSSADFDKFLPKYEKLIEQYFRRLAEESNRQR